VKEVDMEEKKFMVGDTVVAQTDVGQEYSGRIFGVVTEAEKAYSYGNCITVDFGDKFPCPQIVSVEGVEKVDTKRNVSHKDLQKFLGELCSESDNCKKCPINALNYWTCNPVRIAMEMERYGQIIAKLHELKAQKEQEEKHFFKSGDIAIDTRDGELVMAVEELTDAKRKGERSFAWLNNRGRKLGYKLVCKAEDRVDRAKQD